MAHLWDTSATKVTMPFVEERVAEARELMGDNYGSYGVEANRTTLETFLRHHHSQGLSSRLAKSRNCFIPRHLNCSRFRDPAIRYAVCVGHAASLAVVALSARLDLVCFAFIGRPRPPPEILSASTLREASITFWTCTVWRDEASMRAFMVSGAHRWAMPKLVGAGATRPQSHIGSKTTPRRRPGWKRIAVCSRKGGDPKSGIRPPRTSTSRSCRRRSEPAYDPWRNRARSFSPA